MSMFINFPEFGMMTARNMAEMDLGTLPINFVGPYGFGS